MMLEFRLKRLQRAVEYILLSSIFLFFLLAFHGLYEWWLALGLGLVIFGMNFQLTQLRERRRLTPPRDRSRIIADMVESVLLLLFVVGLLGIGGIWRWMDLQEQEYLAYIASILMGLFLAGLTGEIYWQVRNFHDLDDDEREHYIANLKRTIILPYTISRRK